MCMSHSRDEIYEYILRFNYQSSIDETNAQDIKEISAPKHEVSGNEKNH